MRTWKEILLGSNAEIIEWAESKPWARRMAECLQDPQWHAEGDVWTHTRLVCAELEKLEDWAALDRLDQIKLLFTALFHDSAKPATTVIDPESGRTRSPKHSIVGESLARGVLRELGCDLAPRESICALVRYHGRPAFLMDKPEPEKEVISLSWVLSNKLLHMFAVADTRGRDAGETARPEEILQMWKIASEEQGCLDRPYAFANDQARFLFYRHKLTSLHYTPREDYRCQVTMLSALPGAGKDTWLARHRSSLPVVSLDAIREELDVSPGDNQGHVVQAAREQCREYLREGRDFAFNATNLTRQLRGRWLNLFADYTARIEIVYLEPPLTQILKQNKKRIGVVPETIIHRLMEKLEPPTLAEAHGLILAGEPG